MAISKIWLVMLLLWETGDSRREICISVNVAENQDGKCDVRLFIDKSLNITKSLCLRRPGGKKILYWIAGVNVKTNFINKL